MTHPLFRQYPLIQPRRISIGEVPTPYHVYNGRVWLIGGTADLATAQRLVSNEAAQPIQTTAGKALMAVWVCDFTEASLGPHYEVQFSIFVARETLAPVSAHPLAVLQLLVQNPAVRMRCHGLWNNTEKVVAYNREVLGLDARLMHGVLEPTAAKQMFSFVDAAGSALLAGSLQRPTSGMSSANWGLMQLMGGRGMFTMALAPWLTVQIVNAAGAEAQAYTTADKIALNYWNPTDQVTLQHAAYAGLGFQPVFVETLEGVKFVYLNPHS